MKPVINIIAGLFLFATACEQKEESHHQHMHHNHEQEETEAGSGHDHHKHHQGITAGEPTDMSIYNLSSDWTTSEGHSLTLQDLEGKIQVVAMVYTTCEYACPRIMSDMKRIRDEVNESGLSSQVNYTIVTIDPERDTPERLKEFAMEHKLSSENWNLLHGKESDIRELAALLGIRYKKSSEKDYSHSNLITVLDPAGEIVHQQEGLGNEPDATISAIKKLAI